MHPGKEKRPSHTSRQRDDESWFACGGLLGRMERATRGPLSQARRNLVWFAALLVTVGGQVLLLDRLFTWQHPGEVLCTSLVWKWFFLPPIVLFLTGALWGVRERNRQAAKVG
jgi:hypothetical protein